MYRLSIDTGGTFTDLTAADESGHIVKAKVPSSHDVHAFMPQGLAALSANLGLSADQFLKNVGLLVHGTTVPLNTLLQERGTPLGLICTEGFRDTLEIRLGYRDKRYDFTYQTPPPLVLRHLRLPVRERVDRNGKVVAPLNLEDVDKAFKTFEQHGIESIVVCLLWSFLNPDHERKIRDRLLKLQPSLDVWLSSEICPELREYERVSTTTVNGYIAKSFASHQDSFEGYLRSAGYEGEIRYLQSNGGLAGSHVVRALPVTAMFSGPAAGPSAGHIFARLFHQENVIVGDMGGTSFDACLITGGQSEISNVFHVGRHRIRSPAINVESIGAGGGSIASVDHGLLSVGPVSAGANPGPACYGRGGTDATVTDANLVLGYISPNGLLGGTLKLHRELSHQAIQKHVADPLGISVERAALGIFQVVNRNMADALRDMTLGKGRDPRDFVFIAGGGAGPVHAGMLAQAVGIQKVLVPKVAAELCSFGGLVCSLRHDYRRSCASRIQDLDFGMLNRLLTEMEDEGRAELEREGATENCIAVTRVLDMRYKDQIIETPIDITGLTLSEATAETLLSRFHKAYHDIYRYSQTGQPCEIISARVTVIAKAPTVRFQPTLAASRALSDVSASSRAIVLPDSVQRVTIPVYQAETLGAGHIIEGPSIVEEPDTSIVVFPGWRLVVTDHPAYLMTFDTSKDGRGNPA
jgi:N-methylhydantoinase A